MTWKTSKNGNRYLRLPDGGYLTVFETQDGYWKFVHAGDFSDEFETQEDAIAAAEDYLEVD